MPVIPRSSGLAGRRGIRLPLSLLSVALGLAALFFPSSRRPTPSGSHLELGPGPDLAAFARATQPRSFTLPTDHGPHPDYQTEWWYYTGNLVAADGRRFGFQLTFFRRGLSPGPPPEGPGLASNQIYFAHFAITDVPAGRHTAVERFSRGASGLAGATGQPFAVWLEDWRAESRNADGSAVRLTARDAASGLSLDLDLEATKPLVGHGDRGLSPKSNEPGNASYYVGYTRMAARGRLGTAGAASGPAGLGEVEVAGEAWFDHEWSTSALGAGAVGWDWLSLQFDDGRELMLFQIRREDGSIEPVSGGTLVDGDGHTRRLSREDVRIEVLRRWTSPETGSTYPSRWRLTVPSEGLDLLVEPWLDAQEMRTSFVYWEGAVRVSGAAVSPSDPGAQRRPGRLPLTGQGYVELTGYATSMHGIF
ncbi:MAG TPA: lipocalin-like domain-containing protein [Vicinamibacteria bacterium]|nr:lipocalin-like domain-containing protein [Vicinamibacteria bacterium]